ncbi:alpha/beta hydrolase [Sphingomonas sp. S2-65]|uniref:alpha/beta hydrolase n=1 Tax=Sphingomonas sp. S2-65 TaxID=2903960 RepID=UPI001F15799F|nr:alpha/beta hydrolase [Sphingomonas sp. S2-65]UYY59595.1 alpha/beta hydrolase [Sphingomonas sp. S2-65]
MTALIARDFSLVTLSAHGPIDLAAMIGLQTSRQAYVPFRADTAAERNLLGARIDAAVTQADRAVVLVAEGAACFAAAWWARLSPAAYVSRVAGALLLAPMDEEHEHVEALRERFASPRTALPFPSVVLDAAIPRLDLAPQVRALAHGWGSQLLDERAEADTPLRRTRRAIERFTAAVVESKVRAAESLASLGR